MQNTSSTYSYKIINDHFSTRRLQSNYSLSLTLLCYLQTIQAINALTSPSDRHNYKKTEQCNSSIQDGLFEHSVTLLSYPSPCLRGNFSPQKRHKERGWYTAPQHTEPFAHLQGTLCLADARHACLPACLLKEKLAPSGSGTRLRNHSTQHTSEPHFWDLNSCSSRQSLEITAVGREKKREVARGPARAVCLGFSKRIFLSVHCSSLTPAEA